MLADPGGFRRYVRQYALDHQLTGTIQRTNGTNVEVTIEGALSDINSFESFLQGCLAQDVFENNLWLHDRKINRRLYSQFLILSDKVYEKSKNNPLGVVTGRFSDRENEIASVASYEDTTDA